MGLITTSHLCCISLWLSAFHLLSFIFISCRHYLAQLSSDESTQILYDYQLKKTMDERVLQRETIEKGMKKGVREGIKKGMRKGKIKDVVKLIVDIDEAMKDFELVV